MKESDKPLISFIVAAYNVSGSIERCLKSIYDQSLENIEIIVINDRSTDNTLEKVHTFAEKDQRGRIKVISHTTNKGLAAVRNTGLLSSNGIYIWHIDGDDYLAHIDAAKFVTEIFSKENTPLIKVGVYKEYNEGDFNKNCESFNAIINPEYEVKDPSELLKKNGLGGVFGYIFNRDLALQTNIFNLEGINIGEDQILLSQIYRIFPVATEIKNIFYVYDNTSSSLMRSKWTFERFLEDRIYGYLIFEIFSGKPSIFSELGKQRVSHAVNKQILKAYDDLENHFSNFLSCIYIYDFLKFNQFINKDSLNKNIKRGYQNLIKTFQYPYKNPSCFFNKNIIKYFFHDLEFVLHIGVHKTATTYIQKVLEKNKYDLALRGIIVVDFRIFRDYINSSSDLSEKNLFSNILKAIIPNLFTKPKKIIISDENILFPGNIPKSEKKFLFNIASCSPKGFQTRKISQLVRSLPKSKLYLAIRDYGDYLISLHCERCIWNGYYNIDKSVKDWNFDNSCNWNYLISKLYEITNNARDSELFITRYEDYKDNPISFTSLLVGLKLNDEVIVDTYDRKITRNKASKETIEIIEKYSQGDVSKKSIDKFYVKLLNYNHGYSTYQPEFIKNNSFFNKIYSNGNSISNSYHAHCKSIDFIDIPFNLSKLEPIENMFSFKSLTDFKNIHKQFNQEKYEDFQKNIFSTILRPTLFKNIEDYSDYFYYRDQFKSNKGLSAMLRVKNEEDNIKNVLQGIKEVFDEIILIDNNSQDNTLEIVKSLKETDEIFKQKIKIYNYPFNVAKCGIENFNQDPRSVHSLAYFYNFCLSKCSFSYVMKWDGDMLLPKSMVNNFKSFISSLMQNQNPVLGIPKGLTVYKGFDQKFYYRENVFEEEIRVFNNLVSNYFVKDVLWERFQSDIESESIQSGEAIFIEFKDVSVNEFSHWNSGDLGMGMRKRREINDFKVISELTSDSNAEIASEIEKSGFKAISPENILNF